jgi:hypothetical protein
VVSRQAPLRPRWCGKRWRTALEDKDRRPAVVKKVVVKKAGAKS